MSSEKYLQELFGSQMNIEDIKKTIIVKRVSPFIKFFPDGLTLKYKGTGLYYMDIAVFS